MGKVSFITSNNIYVKFESTEHISVGDTLKFMNQINPCLLVTSKSSKSLVCSTLNECIVNKGDVVYFLNLANKPVKANVSVKEEPVITETDTSDTEDKTTMDHSLINGRFSVASSSALSELRGDIHSIMSTISLNATHIKNTGFSFESYLNYRQNFISEDMDSSVETTFFNVYDLNLRYDFDPSFSIVLGRKINPKISSVGAIDGLQIEKSFGKNYLGAISGFRPDMYDYSFNSDLFEYGAYVGRASRNENFYAETTLGFLEQLNKGETDRRFVYFQHSSTINSKLNLFTSLELDLSKKLNDSVDVPLRLTNLYASARYRFNRNLDLSVSYDSRKRILYYETFQTEIEKLLDEDLARQGLRMNINVRPIKNLQTGFSYSKRFQSDDQNKSDNLYGYISLSKIPLVGGALSFNYNMNTSNYMKSNILSIRHSRTLVKNKLDADFYYRLADYDYFNSLIPALRQSYFGTNFSYNINRELLFGVFAEYSSSSQEDYFRINTRIVKRFNNKRKK